MSGGDSPITVLLVDDDRVDRENLRQVFALDPTFEVVGEAADGEQAIRLAQALEPRLITLDLVMPKLDGLTAIEEIMATAPTRILVVSAAAKLDGMDANFEAISRGALDVIAKPWPWPASPAEQQAIRELGRRLASVPVLTHVRGADKRRRAARAARAEAVPAQAALVVIGASTGGPAVLRTILAELPADFAAPVAIVQHLGEDFAVGFVSWLRSHTGLRVAEAESGTCLAPGWSVVGTRGPHFTVRRGGGVALVDEPAVGGHRPAIDRLFASAAEAYGPRCVGVLLTGMGADGAAGLKAIADAGGRTVVQSAESCAVNGMPRAAVALGAAQRCLPPEQIATFLVREIEGFAAEYRID